MYLISAVLPIFSLLCFQLGSLTVIQEQIKREVLDGNVMLDETIVDMNQENMKLIDQDVKDSLYFDENNLEEELAKSEKVKPNAMLNLIIIVAVIVLSIAIACSILIILCRKYGFCKKKK